MAVPSITARRPLKSNDTIDILDLNEAEVAPELTKRAAVPGPPPGAPMHVVKGLTAGALTGVVTWFSLAKGYGIVKVRDGDLGNVLVHRTAVENAGYAILKAGEEIAMKVIESSSRSRPVATEIVKMPGTADRRL